MSSNRCPQCGTEGSIIRDFDGKRVCTACGLIIQENALVNEITFMDNANGTASVMGQFVPSSGMMGGGGSTSTQTFQQGINRIETICDYLEGIPEEVRELARRIYQVAVKHRFTRGRTIEIVSAASVYVAIRVNRTSGFFLDDVAEHISCGTYELAATSLRLAQAVNQPLPTIDPTLYIGRFLVKLNLGRNSKAIHDTAIHLIRRMDRDWIQTGRKPSGVVGAAIMLAAKLHHVDVSKDMIIDIGRVCQATINKRLREIAETDLAKHSLDVLRSSESILDEDSNELPPAMKKDIKEELEEIAVEIKEEEKKKPSKKEQRDDFTDPALASVDNLILSDAEQEKRGALFYALYKSKVNQPPKESKPKKPRKNRPTPTAPPSEITFSFDPNNIEIGDDINEGEDGFGDDGDDGFGDD